MFQQGCERFADLFGQECRKITQTINALWGPPSLTFEVQISNLLDHQTEQPVVYMASLTSDQKTAAYLATVNFPDDPYHNSIVTAAHDICAGFADAAEKWYYMTSYASGASVWTHQETGVSIIMRPKGTINA